MKHEFRSTVVATVIHNQTYFPVFSVSPERDLLADNEGEPVDVPIGFDAFRTCTLMPEFGKEFGGVFHQYASGRTLLLVPAGQYAIVYRNIPIWYDIDDGDVQPSPDELVEEEKEDNDFDF